MSSYKELADRLRGIQPQKEVFCCGKVVSVDGLTCMVAVGSDKIEASLRATEVSNSGEILVVPAVGSAVICGCINGDYSQLVVLAMDSADKILITGEVVLNGGALGGLVNIRSLTAKLNELVSTFNSHKHGNGNNGSPTNPPQYSAKTFKSGDYEDTKIKH